MVLCQPLWQIGNNRMILISHLGRMVEDAVIVYLVGGTDENHDQLLSGQPVSLNLGSTESKAGVIMLPCNVQFNIN